MNSIEVSQSALCRVAQCLGASTIELSRSRVCEQIRVYSESIIRKALARLTQEGAATRCGSTWIPMYVITAFGRQQYLGDNAPSLADTNAWRDQRAGWTEARIDELRRLCAEGYCFSDIAKKLGGGLTRNACIGKAARLGFTNHDRPVQTEAMRRPRKPRTNGDKPKTVRREKSFTVSCAGLRPAVNEYAEPPRELSAEAIPIEQRKRLLDLEYGDCRFPYGDPGKPNFFFCGAESLPFQPYCQYHCSIAFNGFGRPPQRNSYSFERSRKIF